MTSMKKRKRKRKRKKEGERENEREKERGQVMHFIHFWLIAAADVARSLLHKLVSLLLVLREENLYFEYIRHGILFFAKFLCNLVNSFSLSLSLFVCVRVYSLCNKTRIFSFHLPLVIASNFKYHMIQKNKFFIQYFSEH